MVELTAKDTLDNGYKDFIRLVGGEKNAYEIVERLEDEVEELLVDLTTKKQSLEFLKRVLSKEVE